MSETVTRIYELQVKTANASLQSLNAIKQSAQNTEKSLVSLQKAGRQVMQGLGAIGLGVSLAEAVTHVVHLADAFNYLEARLKIVGSANQTVSKSMEDIVRISQATRSSVTSVGTLYARVAAATKEVGLSQQTLAETTQAFAGALKVSGASASETSSAILQFSQALSSGVLAGEEFRAISEASPRFMQAMQEALGKTTGELRKMSKEGQLTRSVMIESLLKSFDKITKEMESIPLTISGAFTMLNNELFATIGTIDNLSSGTEGLANTFKEAGGAAIKGLAIGAVQVMHVFQGIGREIGGVAAQLVAFAQLDFSKAMNIRSAMVEDADKARVANEKMIDAILNGEASRAAAAEAGKKRTKEQLEEELKRLKIEDARKKSAAEAEKLAKEQARDYESVSKALSEQIAVMEADVQTTDQLTAAQKYNIKIQKDLETGAIKLNKQDERSVQLGLARLLQLDVLNTYQKQYAENLKKMGVAAEEFLAEEQKVQDLINEGIRAGRLNLERIDQNKQMLTLREREKAIILEVRKAEDAATASRKTAFENIKDPILYQQALEGIDAELARQITLVTAATGALYDYSTAWDTGARVAIAKYADEVQNTAALTEKMMTDAFQGMEDALVNFVQTGKLDFKSLVDSMIADLTRLMIRKTVMKPLMDAVEGFDLIGSLGKLFTFSAKGNVFNSPSLSNYSGQVHTSPKVFAFKKGAGVFAEAGPEAIMPLKRGRDGSLGVEASGGGQGDIFINVINESKAEVETRASTGTDGKRMIEMWVRDSVTKGFSSGAFDGIMGSTYGLNRRGAM